MEHKNLCINSVDFWKDGMRIWWSSEHGCGQIDFIKSSGEDFDDPYVFEKDSLDKLVVDCYSEYMATNEDRKFVELVMQKFTDMLTIHK